MLRWMMTLTLSLGLAACGGDTDDTPETEVSEGVQKGPEEGSPTAKMPKNNARSGKASKRKKGKGTPGAKSGGRDQEKSRGPAKAPSPIGVAGVLEGSIHIEHKEQDDGSESSLATLNLTWEGGEKSVSLGTVPAKCTSVSPTPIGPEGKKVTPLWMVDCDGAKADAKIVLHQREETLYVRRALVTGKDMTSPYKVVKRIKLAEGATVSRKP